MIPAQVTFCCAPGQDAFSDGRPLLPVYVHHPGGRVSGGMWDLVSTIGAPPPPPSPVLQGNSEPRPNPDPVESFDLKTWDALL